MTKTSKKIAKVPNLRFPEFSEEWKKITLGDCSLSLDYGMNAAATNFDGINRYIRITDIDDISSKYKSDSPVSPTGELEDKYLVKKNDILFARTGASTGKSYLYKPDDGKLYFAGFLIRVKIDSNYYNANFIFNQTKTVSYNKWVKLMSMRSGQPGINSQEYASFKFGVPLKSEQNKIASFLSLIDERIQTQSEVIAQLESLMLGLREKIFKQELRFKDEYGNNFPNWEIKKLKDVGEIYNGLSGKTKEDFGKGKPYIQYKQIFDQSKIDVSKCDLVDIDNDENQNKVTKGDMFFTISSETPEEIGMSSVLLEDVKEVYLNSFCFGYRPKSLKVLYPSFARYLFRSEFFRKEIKKLAQGSTRYNMSKTELLKLKIGLPVFKEQIKIATFLNALNNKIDNEARLLQRMKNQKQYLLKNIFI